MLRKTVLVRALAIAFSAGALGAAVTPAAMAQSNATGTIFGKVAPGADVRIVIENNQIGIRRTITPDAQGRFQATSLPTGTYTVKQMKGEAVVATSEVDARLGQGSEAVFVSTDSGVQRVEISAVRRTIDVSSTNNGASFNARQLAALPIGRNVESIIQLAPNTTRADSRFSGGASFGGGAASENSYYINGFPVVNPLTGLGASQLPFGAIQEAQVLTGGFGAEFGRSVGGVVNIITKSGTNTWEAGANVTWAPRSWRADPIDFYYAKTGAPSNATTDGTLRLARAENTLETKTYGAYVGGPIIQDKLFFFLAGEAIKTDEGLVNGFRVGTSNARNGWRDRQTDIKRYMGKLDWNIAENHRLEFTALGDTPEVSNQDSGFDYDTRKRVGTVTSSAVRTNVDNNGGDVLMLKYTGNLTDDLTFTALTGRSEAKHENEFTGYNPNLFSTVSTPADAPVPVANPQALTGNILAPGSKDIVKSNRLDLEYKWNNHTIRAGVDQNKVTSLNAGEFKAGGGTWAYFRTDTPNAPIDATGGTIPAPASGGGYGTDGYYVSKRLFSTVTTSYGEQSAFYIEDKYQITKDVLITAGIRREGFKNQNDSKTTFLDMKAQINPRLAVAWDVNGDSSFKVFGTAGRYSVPIPTHIAVRGAGRSTYTDQYYTYTGIDANGAPTGLTQLTEPLSGNNEFGQDKVVATLAALDMKPSYQDELTIGFEKAFSPNLNFGAKATHRQLKSTIDDFCDVRPFEDFADRNGITSYLSNPLWGNTCQTFNPGRDNTFYVDFAGTGTNLTKVFLTAQEQGFEKPVRKYTAVDLFAEHPFRNGWYGKVNYTWSKNIGNTEGQVRSDNGQADVAVTSVWDYPELMVGAYGRLPNDRKHQLKAYGFYEVTKQIMVGGNLLVASGRPRSCIGSAPAPGDSPNYSNQSFYCYGADRTQNVLTPRGTVGNLPTDMRLDLNVAYRPEMVKGLMLKLDVFNVTNRQTIQNVTEAYNTGTRVNSIYETPLSATAPRSARLQLSYDRKF
ncbi:TonB-dependent receptor [Massilia sp. PAMC28688]|uniref:TonB-dependent receptor n=1 Tax=Massilia sp. PAMC28688 TaxID=2861283 RepID=UPI001C631F17|nr:TonB-dependent receptor [Massilia sp. PAMC28688]QYF94248.1 TonB-dependent receptor [Massilia sp. PAMC28688]